MNSKETKRLFGQVTIEDLSLEAPIVFVFKKTQPSAFKTTEEEAIKWWEIVSSAEFVLLRTDLRCNDHSKKMAFVKGGKKIMFPTGDMWVNWVTLIIRGVKIHSQESINLRERAFSGDVNAQYLIIERALLDIKGNLDFKFKLRETPYAGLHVDTRADFRVLRFDSKQVTIKVLQSRPQAWIGKDGVLAKEMAKLLGVDYVKISPETTQQVTEHFASQKKIANLEKSLGVAQKDLEIRKQERVALQRALLTPHLPALQAVIEKNIDNWYGDLSWDNVTFWNWDPEKLEFLLTIEWRDPQNWSTHHNISVKTKMLNVGTAVQKIIDFFENGGQVHDIFVRLD